MDVIQPKFIWIDNRCYRKNPLSSLYCDGNNVPLTDIEEKGKHLGSFETSEYDDEGDACELVNVPMEQLGDGRFRVKMNIASEYHSKIIGRNGDSKRQIERDTRVQLFIPKKGQSGDVAITGMNPKDVTSAFVRISLIVSNARKRMPFTHFVSIPLTTPEIKTRFLQFKNDVLRFSRGAIEDDLFQNPDKLHLTIGTLVLLTNNDRIQAAQSLQNCKSRIRDIIGSAPIEIEIRGVEYMNDDPSKVDVLYGRCIENSGRLQQLADVVVNSLEADGLLDRQYERVKLHATLMNSLFKVKDDSEENVRSTFNAKPILENWKDYSFGSVTVDDIHLSQRYSTSQSTKYYVASSQMALNQDL
ncbi:activating signal cointegrator 1 complex subunit 1-like [Daphnia pulex]|uniref:activating signal cointegrator 1 complex subunit 1-like n=1 Tax=Daphnia pulex TaxID=6669 RepID=UPI001EE03909|nr:activating signal cointegrator 1 complex subunit 1-like [Daphnia pulex]XP_046446259.1 activating signal cointegrator 1 complex subunit 1-like [Daphnia pulex]